MVIKYYVSGTSADTLYVIQKNQCINYTRSGHFATEFLCLQPTNFFKKYKDSLEQNVHYHNYNTQKNWIYMFNFAVWISLGKLWWSARSIKYWTRSSLFKENWVTSVVTCILFSAWIYAIKIACGFYEYVNSINCHTYLFELLLILHYILSNVDCTNMWIR